MIVAARLLLFLAIAAGDLLGPQGPKAATQMYSDRSAWSSRASLVGTESYESHGWANLDGNLLVLGGSYRLGTVNYQVPPGGALYGIGAAFTRDAPYLSASYLEWQGPAAGISKLTIILPAPATSIGFDFGQFNGASLPFTVTLGTGETFDLATSSGAYKFAGFVSDRRFSTLTLSAPAFPVIDNLAWGQAADPNAVPGAIRLSRNPAGVGHVLVIPYFSLQDGNATLINIVNTDLGRGKAVKVRFRGASNADAVFDFQVFMTPGDVWSANISRGADGRSTLTTADRSCTLPASVNQPFITSRLNPDLSADALANEAREGYVEILTMGDILPSAETTSLGHAIQHNDHGVPPCTASILASLTQGDARLLNPTTGLKANWTIINVANTTTWSGEALALEARSQGLAAEGRNLYWPQTATPLKAGQIEANTSDPLLLAGMLEAASHDLPDLSTPYTTGAATPIAQAAELSDALAATKVAAEYLTDPAIGASTDWIVSQPTRRYYAAVDYAAFTPEDRLVTNYDDRLIHDADYYRSRLSDGAGLGNTMMGNSANGCQPWQAAVLLDADKFWNREGAAPTPVSPIATPAPLPPMVLCGAVAVIGINSPMSPVQASVTRINWVRPRPDAPSYGYLVVPNVPLVDGWGTFTALNPLTPSRLDGVNLGLPVLVTQFSKATNSSAAPGVAGTFGGAWNARVLEPGKFFAP